MRCLTKILAALPPTLLLSGCFLSFGEQDNEVALAKLELLDEQLEREHAQTPPPDPCAAIHYPGDDASSLAFSSYYVAITACTAGKGGTTRKTVPSSVQIAKEFTDAEKAKDKNETARSKLWMEGILGVIGVATDLHIASEDRKTQEHIADLQHESDLRDAENPSDGAIWVQDGGQYIIHTDSHNDSSDNRSNYDNDQSDHRADYDNDKSDNRADYDNDKSDNSDQRDQSDQSVTEDNDTSSDDDVTHTTTTTEDNDSTTTTSTDTQTHTDSHNDQRTDDDTETTTNTYNNQVTNNCRVEDSCNVEQKQDAGNPGA